MRGVGYRTFADSDVSVAWILGGESLPSSLDPDAPALVWLDGEVTYAELRRSALALARSLRNAGLEPGDTVLCHLFNRGETFQIYFACAYAGLTLVPASFRLTEEELAHVVSESRARVIFTESELVGTARSAAVLAGEGPRIIELGSTTPGPHFEKMLEGPPLPGPFVTCDPHLVMFSSGSTGEPKGVMMSHASIVRYAFIQTLAYPGYRAGMRLLNVPAMFNAGGINEICIPTFLAGGTVFILPSRGWTAEGMIELIERWGITHTVIFPTMFSALFAADSERRAALSSLELVITGGEACPPALMEGFRERWPHVELLIAYGLTEGGLVSLMSGEEAIANPLSVGRSAVGSVFRIGDDEAKPLPLGDVGEVWVASDSLAMGYWNAPELDATAFRDGWFRTGDLGRVDDRGYLYLEGRSRDLIISKGQNIFPAEIEAALLRHPGIRGCAVVGAPDTEFGEAVVAFVVLASGISLTADDVRAIVTESVASYKKPHHVIFIDALPIGTSNKVLKRDLEELAAESVADRLRPYDRNGLTIKLQPRSR